MLALVIVLLFTLAAALAMLTIADSAIKAREAYGQLMREAALMQAGFTVQVQPQELWVRRAPGRILPAGSRSDRRSPGLRMQTPACAA